MAVQVPVGKSKKFAARFVDASGNPTTVDTRSTATVEVSDPALASIGDLAPDGLSGTVTVTGIGAVQVRLTADADLGDGVRPLVLIGELEGIAGEAVGGTIDFTDQP